MMRVHEPYWLRAALIFVVCGLLFPLESRPQSFTLYSPCRDRPPDDPVAQRLFEAMQRSRNFDELQEQLDALNSKPRDNLNAIEAEAYLLLVPGLINALNTERFALDGTDVEAILQAGKHSRDIAAPFADNSFVRCAYLYSEVRMVNDFPFNRHFSDGERTLARDNYRQFMESAIAGDVTTDTAPYRLHYAVGQLYLDTGYKLLPNKDKAAPLFEAGAMHLLDAASSATDEAYINNWKNYRHMLEKLPLAHQDEIAHRLLTHLEQQNGGGTRALTTAESRAYVSVLKFAGSVSIERKNGSEAVTILQKYLQAIQQPRQRAPDNSNYKVAEAHAYLSLGDALLLVKDRDEALRAYRSAAEVFESSSGTAREVLSFQEFPDELAARLKSL